MSHEDFTHAYGSVQIGDEPPVSATNYNPDERMLALHFTAFVNGTQFWRSRLRPTSSVMFLRPGKLRYTKPNVLAVTAAPDASGFVAYNSGGYDQYYLPISEVDFSRNYFDSRNTRAAYGSPTYGTSEVPHVFSRVAIAIWGNPSGTTRTPTGGPSFPTNYFDGLALSSVDIPGTQIGQLFKHPTGRAAWGNEVGIVALSQGNVEIRGPYSPPESLLQHMGYQVYYTKSGGTGRPGNAVNAQLTEPVQGTNGTVSAPGTFTDGAAQGLFQLNWASGSAPGAVLVTGTATGGSVTSLQDTTKAWAPEQYRDKLVQITFGTGAGQTRWIAANTATSVRVSVAWDTAPDATSQYRLLEPSLYYLRINSGSAKGTYLIVSVSDTNTLLLDAPAIKNTFSSESGLNWEIVTGPVGEYFYRKRSYQSYYYWGASSWYWNGNLLNLGSLQNEVLSLQNTTGASSNNVIHDRGACWWAVANNGTVPLMRWVHMSPQAFEPMHTAGKISGLATWPYLNGCIRDIAIDDQNKIWVVGDPTDGAGTPVRNGRTSTLRIDPYPAGDAHTPTLISSYSGDMSAAATPSNPLGANDIRGVVCDDSKAYAPNTRVWLIPGTANALNAVTYTDDYGATWKRLYPLHSRTGTASVGGTAVTGTGTLFTTEFAAGDWVRFGQGIGACLNLNSENGGSRFSDTGSASSIVTPVGGAVATTTESKFGGSSLALNGTDAYVSMPWNSDLTFETGDFTVECWLYLTATPNGEAFITDQSTGGGDEIAWAFHFTTTTPGATTGDKIAFGSYNGSSWTGVVSTSTPALNTWVHLAACRSGGTLKLFMDGTEIASDSFSTNIPIGDALWIGRRWDTAGTRDFVSGYMNDVRAIKGAALYTAPFTPPTAALTGTRSYEIASITDDTTMTLASPVASSVTNSTIARGVFPNATVATTPLWQNTSAARETVGVMRTAADYDTSGNLVWLASDANHIVRWNPGTGNADVMLMSTAATPVTIDSGDACSLTVQRVPNPDSMDTHRLHNSIWIGTRYQGLTRLEPSFSGLHTRYHWTLSDSWPSTGYFGNNNGNNIHVPRAVVNPLTGETAIYVQASVVGSWGRRQWVVSIDQNTRGTLLDQGHIGTQGGTWPTYWAESAPMLCANYDDIGLGMRAAINPVRYGADYYDRSYNNGALFGERWLCKRWNGIAWNYGPLNEYNSTLDFAKIEATPGPYLDMPVNVGTGVKRMHPDWQTLDADTKLQIRFVDTSVQAVSQEQQFIVDENTTFICYIGKGKDNTQTAYWAIDMHMNPTFTRFGTESTKLVRNIWTQDGGIEGGYSISGDSTQNYTPPFSRGISLPSGTVPHGGAPYPNLSDVRYNTGPWQQYTAALRVKPELESAGDGSIFGGVVGAEQKFTSAGYTFVTADVGKSIIIEGANGAGADPDNGQAVILSIDPLDSKTVITDKTFVSAKTGLRWKLMNIPAVAYVALCYDYIFTRWMLNRTVFWLFSSADRGVTYQQVKFADTIRDKTANSDIRLHQDEGVFFNVQTNPQFNYRWSGDQNATNAATVYFDLRSLPENVRRRQYWKTRAVTNISADTQYMRCVGLTLLDENFQLLGIPANCRVDDALDPEFRSMVVYEANVRLFSGTGITPVDVGAGNGRTDTLTFTGSFYTQSDTNNASLSGSNFSSAGASFVPQDVGKLIRISGAANSVNNGFCVITAYVDATTVTTDRAFTAETNSFSWALLTFGSGSWLRVIDSTYIDSQDPTITGINLTDSKFTISDVPAANTLKITTTEFPLSVTNKNFSIEVTGGAGDYTLSNNIGTTNPSPPYDEQKRWSHDINGLLAWSAQHEFVVLQQDAAATATSAADDDGDSRTDQVTLAVTLASPAVAGDYLMLSNSTNGRRVYEIKSITPDVPSAGQTTIVVTYDEIFTGQTFSWQVLRRRDTEFTYPRLLVVTKS